MTAALAAVLPATWDSVLGQDAAATLLRGALQRSEVAHAWLLVGTPGVGQQELARALAAALNCPRSTDPVSGCGHCSTCDRIARGTHPAALDFEPEGAMHVVDAVRGEWVPAATRTLSEGRRKVLRVLAADRMNDGAQNAFLKVLEEPPPSVVWLLEAEDPGALLDTVVSRCRRVDLAPWKPAALAALADRLGVAPGLRDGLVRAAMGSPERLRDLVDPDLARARDDHLALVGRLAEQGPGAIVPLAKELAGWARERSRAVGQANAEELAELEEAFGVDGGRGWPPGVKQRLERRFARLERQAQRRALELLLDNLAAYLRDLVAVAAGADDSAVVNVDHRGHLERDAGRLPPAAALEAQAAIARCREALDVNGAPELQLERLLLAIALPLYRSA